MTLHPFSLPARAWFEASFEAPTPAQVRGWPAIASGDHTLILAPTGSGKTLAAFLWALDRLAGEPTPSARERCRGLYVSPLKALTVDEDGARSVTVVDAGHRKPMEVEVIVPVEDMAELGKPSDELRPGSAVPEPERVSIWISIHPRLLELIRQHRSTLVFDAWVDPLVDLAKEGRLRKIEPQRTDVLPDLETPRADRLREAGFVDSCRGLALRG